MCGRYFIDDGIDSEELYQIIDEVNRKSEESSVKTSGEIFPTDVVPVIAMNRGLSRMPFAMSWGYSLPNGKTVFNARSETAAVKPMFRDGMAQRRCAVPATNYFEWEHGKVKTKFAIKPSDQDMFYMAGIYRFEGHKPVFSILTRNPAKNIEFIHDRMPFILPRDMVNDWIDPKYKAEDILNSAVLSVEYNPVQPYQERLI
ncbi:MAG: SOS response-associated peptidase [Lachnospiraceae bacterium]|nr:SOS response-associated peptidase [Lachnospiraceae bacterium]